MLSVLWIVNEVVNHKLMNVDEMIQRRVPRVLQYGVLQMMLYIMGLMFVVGVMQETGIAPWLMEHGREWLQQLWLTGLVAGAVSSVLDSFASAMSFIALGTGNPQNTLYWSVVAFTTAIAKCGDLLAHNFPAHEENSNELADGLVVLEDSEWF